MREESRSVTILTVVVGAEIAAVDLRDPTASRRTLISIWSARTPPRSSD